jgi:hypothetical protein
VIARQVAHISHLIDDLLDVEHVVSGKIRGPREGARRAATPCEAAGGVRGIDLARVHPAGLTVHAYFLRA